MLNNVLVGKCMDFDTDCSFWKVWVYEVLFSMILYERRHEKLSSRRDIRQKGQNCHLFKTVQAFRILYQESFMNPHSE